MLAPTKVVDWIEKECISQLKVKRLLSHMLKTEILPQVFLFYGDRGVGKRTFARAFAKCLVQSSHTFSPDIIPYVPDEKSDVHTILSMRDLKIAALTPPFAAPFKVLIIEDAHKMVSASSQTLLKTLEEPALACKIILTAPSLGSLLPTIVSRCCKIAFAPLEKDEVISFLLAKKGVDQVLAEKISSYAMGSLTKALAWAEGGLWQETLLDLLVGYTTLAYDLIQEKLAFLEDQVAKGNCLVEDLYEITLYCIRDMMLLKEKVSLDLLFFKERQLALEEASQKIFLSFEKLQKIWRESVESFSIHVKLKVALERLLIKMYEKNTRI